MVGKSPLAFSVKAAEVCFTGKEGKKSQLSLSSYKLSLKEHQIHSHTKTFLEAKVIMYLEMWLAFDSQICEIFPLKKKHFTSQAWHCRAELDFPWSENIYCPLVILSTVFHYLSQSEEKEGRKKEAGGTWWCLKVTLSNNLSLHMFNLHWNVGANIFCFYDLWYKVVPKSTMTHNRFKIIQMK